MKTTKISRFLLLSALSLSFFTSCEKDNTPSGFKNLENGVLVLNQGQDGKNNASLSYYDLTTSLTTEDIFSERNNRKVGDVAQDVIRYGSNIYITLTNSSIVEVVNATTGMSIKTIPMFNTPIGTSATHPSKPRSLAALNGKVYITLLDGHLARLDTTTLTIDKTIAVGTNPEGIAVANNKLYVANSGGYNYQINAKADSTISVIDPATFSEIKKIKVLINPTIIKADKYGDLYVLSMGNYWDIPSALQRIEGSTDKVTAIADVKAVNFTIEDDNAYIYNYEYDAVTYAVINKSYSVYDVKNEKVLKTNFIASSAIAQTPYSIDVDPLTKNVFIGETDYVNTGKMYCFGSDGALKYTFNTGVNPSKTAFITNK
ncbi:MAG: DUF5074 domain-containing protein [Bacteroidales bacterium]